VGALDSIDVDERVRGVAWPRGFDRSSYIQTVETAVFSALGVWDARRFPCMTDFA
jgi:hypothetical protein